MPFVPVTPEQHAQKTWRRYTDYSFAAAEALAPIVAAELANTVGAMPLAFAEENGSYMLAAILSPAPGRNLFVAPDGRWLGGYVPAMLRGYPFRLLRPKGSKDWVLCVDDAMISPAQAAPDEQPFYRADGKLAPPVATIFDFLSKVGQNAAATNAAVAALAAAGVLKSWPLKIKAGEKEQTVSGLHCIDEAVLNGLSDDAYLQLRKAGALAIAYAQLLSMARFAVFQQLVKLQVQLAQIAAAQPPKTPAGLPESLDQLFGIASDDTIRIG